jgi:hypothetical protein
MPSLDMEKLEREDREDKESGIPPRFGYRHEVNYTLENSGEWITLPNGDRIWRLSIHCPDAKSINLLYDKFWLPVGAKLFIYSNNHKRSIGAFTSNNNKGSKDNIQGFTTDLIYSDLVTLEYYLPKNAEEIGVISIAYVVHGYRYIMVEGTRDIGYDQSAWCNININCIDGQDLQNEKHAVAMVLVDGDRWCTGSLVNTTAGDGRLLFLTADHCLCYEWYSNGVCKKQYSATKDSILSNYSFWWNYELPGDPECTYYGLTPFPEPSHIATTGAKVIANNQTTDFALLELWEHPARQGATPYYLGWSRNFSVSTNGVGIHHPAGDVKKISFADYIANYSRSISWTDGTPPIDSYWYVEFYKGYPEGGSSGSPLLDINKRIIGQMYGGASLLEDCSSLQFDPNMRIPRLYGKFCNSWNGSYIIKQRLKEWLDPNNTGVAVLNGTCNVKINNKTYNIDSTYTIAGCTVEISNTTTSSPATVDILGYDEVILYPGFHAEPNSNVIITAHRLDVSPRNDMLASKSETTFSAPNFQKLAQNDITTNSNSFTLYPNPNIGSFQIETNFPLTEIANLKITNLMGAPVYETKNQSSNIIQLQNAATGQYFVVMILKEGSVLTQKMMVQK